MSKTKEVVKRDFETIISKQSVNQRFKTMIQYTDMVLKDVTPSLIVSGGAGTGKTYTIREQIAKAGLKPSDYFYCKGRASVAGLYIALYHNHNKLIVFDDCDSVLQDAEAINVLKAALDSYDVRTISYISAKPLRIGPGEVLPNQFEFTGRIIFISNLDESKIDPAIRSRALNINIDVTQEQMLGRMQSLLETIETKVNMNLKLEAFTALKQAADKFNDVELNMRSLIKAIRIRQMGFENWAMMIAEQCIETNTKKRNEVKAKQKLEDKYGITKQELIKKLKKNKKYVVCEELGLSNHVVTKILNS